MNTLTAETSITKAKVNTFKKTASLNDQLGCDLIKGFHLKKTRNESTKKNNKGETVKVNPRFVWRYRYTDAGGKRRTVTIGDYDAFPAPKEAAGVANSWKYKEVDPLEEKKKKTAEKQAQEQEEAKRQYLKLGAYFKQYEKVIPDSPDVLRKIEVEFKHLFEREMDKLTPQDITAWYNKRKGAGCKRSTLVGYFGALKAMLNHAAGKKKGEQNDNPILEINPLRDYSLPKLTKSERQQALIEKDEQLAKRDIFSDEIKQKIDTGLQRYAEEIREQRRRSRKHGKPHLQDLDQVTYPHWFFPFCTIARLTGMRPSDIYSLRWSNIHTNDLQRTQTLIFTPKKTQHKGENPITVKFPVYKELKEVFDKWREQLGDHTQGLIFKSERTGKELERKAHLKHWEHIKKLGELPDDLQFYSFRHNYISSLLRDGANPAYISKLVGHADTTMIFKNYFRADEDHLHDIAMLAAQSWGSDNEKDNKEESA